MSLGESGFECKIKRMCKCEFFDEMNFVVFWVELVLFIVLYVLVFGVKGGCLLFVVEIMLCIYFIQQWFNFLDLVMEEVLYDMVLFCEFVGLDVGEDNLFDESMIFWFCYLFEVYNLSLQILVIVNVMLMVKGLLFKSGIVVDVMLIVVLSLIKNSSGECDFEMYQIKKGNQWYFGMKVYIGVDVDLGLVYMVVGIVVNVNDVMQVYVLVYGEEIDVFVDVGYQGVSKCDEMQDIEVNWYVVM